ncbi:MAG: hypothetical protein ABI461_18590, partial [Polyangiaceae bacterium]
IASRTHQVHTDPSVFFTYAQAEYFFDCDGKWASGSCNAINDTAKDTKIDAAMYRMEWRARLVRVHAPKNVPAAEAASVIDGLFRERATAKRLEDSGVLSSVYRATYSQIPSNVLDFINNLPAANFH